VDVIVELQSRKHLGVEGYGVNFIIFSHNRENSSKSIVWGIGFYDKLCIWNPMRKDRSKGKGLFQSNKYHSTFVVKIPWSVFSSKTSKQNDYVWIIENEIPVKVGES